MPELPDQYRKVSFREFDEKVDAQALQTEFGSINDSEWSSSYWGDVHCSVASLLLKGGTNGNEQDFSCEDVHDREILTHLPYIASLVGESGPFGEATYAFIFRMKPNGITLAHRDLNEVWKDKFRIHVPIFTNPDAVLISNDRVIHFAAGSAWSFDNYSVHGVVNGPTERSHLIFDVPLNDKLRDQIDRATYHQGWKDDAKQKIIRSKAKFTVASYPGDEKTLQNLNILKDQGMNPEEIAKTMNEKGMPTRSYGQQWTTSEVYEFIPLIFW